MKVTVFSTKSYDRDYLTRANKGQEHELVFIEPHLSSITAPLAQGTQAVCAFVNDHLDGAALAALAKAGVRLIALRCAGSRVSLLR
jgi:D-lactate dehydrogenase